MAYIGAEPVPGQNREVDDISSSFNGSTTAFTLQVSGVNVSPESANNILVNLGGVLQNPGTDYTIAASTLTFTTAPAAGLSFFGLVLGAGINTATVADDTIGASKLIDTAVTAGSYTTADITVDAQGRITAAASGTISGAEIADQAVTNAKVNNSAAIAGSKISPDFGSQNIVTTGSISGAAGTFTGDLTIPDKIVHTGDTDTAIRLGVDTVTAETAGSERIRIDSSGNIGIGTTSPSSVLHISDTEASGGVGLTLTNIGDGGSSTTPFCSIDAKLNPTRNGGQIRFGREGVYGDQASADSFMAFYTTVNDTNTERMRIDSSGNVGIGVTDPDQPLEVNGAIAGNGLKIGRASNVYPVIQRHTAGSGSQTLTITGGAGLAAGSTSAPTFNDALNGAAIRIGGGDPTSDNFGGGISYIANGHLSPNNPGTGNQHVFYRRSAVDTFTEAVRITASGHLKASTSGTYQSITGTFHESHTNTNNQHIHWFQHDGSNSGQQFGIRVRSVNDGNDGNTLLQCSSGSATAGAITRAGSFSSRNNSYGGTSDIKLKENIVDAKSQWDDIKAIKFRNFNFKDNPSKKMLGVIAQEIELVSAGLVEDVIDRDPDTNEDLGTVTKHVKSSILYMKAMKCLQEAMTKIETLETKVAALEAA